MDKLLNQEHPENPLPGYTFNLNDFRTDQFNLLLVVCAKVAGNTEFQKRLKHELVIQEKEHRRFFAAVKKERLKRMNTQLTAEILQKLSFPTFLIPKERSIKRDPGFSLTRWQPPGTFEEIVLRKYSYKESLAALLPGSTELTGWERLKYAFLPEFYVPNYCRYEESHFYNSSSFAWASVGIGLLVGMIMSYSYGRNYVDEFDKINSGNIYAKKADAYRARINSFFKGYLRYVFRWGWRFTFLAGGVYFISQGLCIFRLKESVSHYIAGTFIPFSLYKWHRGPKGMLVYGTLGCVIFGLPLSFLTCFLNCNPRTLYYSASIQPRVSSEYHWSRWNKKQHEQSQMRFEALVREACKRISNDDHEEIYDELFPPFSA